VKKERNFKNNLSLFLAFAKLGLFSFGGGPTMISLLKEDLVDKRNWLNEEELENMIAISESTPGPIAINLATYLGYKRNGILGSIFATLGITLPTFLIMFIISLCFQNLMNYQLAKYAFMGIKCGVVYLLLRVSFKMIKGLKNKKIAEICWVFASIALILLAIFDIPFSAIYLILIGAILGILIYAILLPKISKGEKK